jgi:16S rRNA (guanine527-N7)-methyltransferase
MDRLTEDAAKLGIRLGKTQIEQFEIYYQEILDWNSRINLTAITDLDDVLTKHFLDSLTVSLAAEVLPKVEGSAGLGNVAVIDVGTGAGFPGIPLKIAFSSIRLTLLESVGKKALFLEHIMRVLKLENVTVIAARSEDAAHLEGQRESYDLVVSRAVASLPSLLELTLPFCRIGGIMVAQKSAQAKTEIEGASPAAAALGGELEKIVDIGIPELADRCLMVYKKVASTPSQYPRRAGIPAKRPLA